MQQHSLDEGVFIRSLAARGRLGGLAEGVEGVLALLGQEGFTPLIVETVGVGQSEVEVAQVADSVVLVLYPGWGDEVQTAKAGLLEIADIFFVNKADLGNADVVARQLVAMLALSSASDKPPVLQGSALTGDGVDELLEEILKHRAAR
jgi:LAO/AO transport system kinase